MKKLKTTGKLLVFLLALLMLAGLVPVTVSATVQINSVEIGMADLTLYFFSKYTEGFVDEAVYNNVTIYPGSNFTVDPLNTVLLKKDGSDYLGIYKGHSHMDPAADYYYKIYLEASSGYAFSDPVSVKINNIPIADEAISRDLFNNIRIFFKAPDVAQGNSILYRIKYDANGGSYIHLDDLAVDGIPMTLSPPRFTPPADMKFECWAIESPSGPKAVAGDAVYFTADTTIYAIWQSIAPEETETTPLTTPTSITTPTSESPVRTTTDPRTELSEPTTEVTEPTTEITEPTTEHTIPTTEPTEPVTTVTVPTVTTDRPKTSTTSTIPQTGEDKPILLWGILLLVSGTGLFITSLYFRKKKQEES